MASTETISSRIRSVRMGRFLNILKREFECEIKNGKGSEVTIYRRGAKKIALGRHRRERSVSPTKVKMVLAQLSISLAQWQKVV